MKILWFTWKDKKNPLAGGAEVVNEEIAKRLSQNGHEVIFLVGGFVGDSQKETLNGYEIIRVGNRLSCYFEAYKYFKNNLKNWPDIIIEEINTIPYFTQLYSKQKRFLFVHQLCREIWFYQMIFPFSLIGYLLEPIYLWCLRKNRVITISNSSKTDLIKYGFESKNISIISEGIEMKPITDLRLIKKYENPTILSLGQIRPMKQTLDQIKAYEIAKKQILNLKMIIAGSAKGKYGVKVLNYISKSRYKNDINYLGLVSLDDKIKLMQQSHVILVTSVKEGWGLIVTEANSQGTPAIVYDADGLRDSVIDGVTGLISKNNHRDLTNMIIKFLKDPKQYDKIQLEAYEISKQINFEKCYEDFTRTIGIK